MQDQDNIKEHLVVLRYLISAMFGMGGDMQELIVDSGQQTNFAHRNILAWSPYDDL
ncbi:MAG: hypothetical protein ACP5U1_13570 [Desulfomonilaceae bacterium]